MQYTTYDIQTFPSGEVEISLNVINNIIYCRLNKDLNQSLIAAIIAIKKLSRIYDKITVVMPFLPYSRGEIQPIIEIFKMSGVSKLITIDIHSEVVQLGMDIHNISIIPEVIKKIGINLNQLVIISPDSGGYSRAKNTATLLNCDFISMEKTRENGSIMNILESSDSIRNRNILIVDDIIDSGATINSAADLLYNSGAKSITVLAIHGILSRREFSPKIDKIYVTNTIEQENFSQPKVVDVDNIIKLKIKDVLYVLNISSNTQLIF